MYEPQNGVRTVPIRRSNRRRRKRKNPLPRILFILFLAAAVVGGTVLYKKYAPTREHMPIEELYTYYHPDEAAIIINDTYADPAQEEDGESEDASAVRCGCAVVRDGQLYIEAGALKEYIDDGYVFDDTEGILRYATESDLISVPYSGAAYTVNGEENTYKCPITLQVYEKTFVSSDFCMEYSDFSYTLAESPYRAMIYTVEYVHNVAEVQRNTAIRRLGGPKSKILEDAKKGEMVSVIKNHGNWSEVVSETGVRGFIKNTGISAAKEEMKQARFPAREYKHKTMPGRFSAAWHIITFQESNNTLSRAIAGETVPDVLMPTWFRLSDNEGGISDISQEQYVKTCHDRGIQVWALASDFEVEGIDTGQVLNSTSSRDRLTESLISAVLKVGADGINIDFEQVPAEGADGFAQFIKELSLRCEAADLFLSVDNYIPASYNMYYNRSVQNDYADYVMVMAYDEHHKGGEEAGSNASLPFVKEAIEATLKEVEGERLVLGMPLFSREWIQEGQTLSSEEYSMRQIPSYLSNHRLTPQWSDELGQNYTEYTDGDVKHMLWIEDEESIVRKLELMKGHNLAGGAFWAMTFGPDSIWETFGQYR